MKSGYSDASVLAFTAPVKSSTKPERYIAAKPQASAKLVASR